MNTRNSAEKGSEKFDQFRTSPVDNPLKVEMRKGFRRLIGAQLGGPLLYPTPKRAGVRHTSDNSRQGCYVRIVRINSSVLKGVGNHRKEPSL